MAPPSVYLTPKSLAVRLDVSPRLLERWRADKVGPAFFQVNRTIRYRLDAVERWEAARLNGEVAA
jgi:predicted transcriptional regulator